MEITIHTDESQECHYKKGDVIIKERTIPHYLFPNTEAKNKFIWTGRQLFQVIPYNYLGTTGKVPSGFDPLKENINLWAQNNWTTSPYYPIISWFHCNLIPYLDTFHNISNTHEEVYYLFEHSTLGQIAVSINRCRVAMDSVKDLSREQLERILSKYNVFVKMDKPFNINVPTDKILGLRY